MKAVVLASIITVVSCQVFRKELDGEWQKFKENHNRRYLQSHEEIQRRRVFESNLQKISQHNKEYELGLHSFRLAINQFTDLTSEEFTRTLTNNLMPRREVGNLFTPTGKSLPATVDWRDQNVVTPIKNQGRCSSCWAFSAIGSLESHHAIATGNLVNLSEQNLVDCTRSNGHEKCAPFHVHDAFRYIINNGGVDTQKSYPYVGFGRTCRFHSSNIGATMKAYKFIPPNDEAALQEVVATIGPVAVYLFPVEYGFNIDSSAYKIQFYSEGIIDSKNCLGLTETHCVVVIGYGTENGQDYWLAKNSWGIDWGEKGYVKMARNKNYCDIASFASYPIV